MEFIYCELPLQSEVQCELSPPMTKVIEKKKTFTYVLFASFLLNILEFLVINPEALQNCKLFDLFKE